MSKSKVGHASEAAAASVASLPGTSVSARTRSSLSEGVARAASPPTAALSTSTLVSGSSSLRKQARAQLTATVAAAEDARAAAHLDVASLRAAMTEHLRPAVRGCASKLAAAQAEAARALAALRRARLGLQAPRRPLQGAQEDQAIPSTSTLVAALVARRRGRPRAHWQLRARTQPRSDLGLVAPRRLSGRGRLALLRGRLVRRQTRRMGRTAKKPASGQGRASGLLGGGGGRCGLLQLGESPQG